MNNCGGECMLHGPRIFKIARQLSLLLIIATSGCALFSSAPRNQEEAGAVNVSVTLVAPWDEYIAALTPNFTLTANDAVSKVIPRTGIVEEKILDALGLSARVGLPQTFESLTKNISTKLTKTDNEEPKETTTLTTDIIEKKEPGKLPDAPSKAPGADKGIKDLPGVPSDSGKSLSDDPLLEYTAATALYQEVQLLNRYVSDAALRHEMDAYIVRLQIGIVPFRRNLPYDVYTKIGFFPKTDAPEDMPAYVLPLLVTDSLEGALVSRSRDTIRQLSLAASFMKGGIVGTVGGDKLKEELKSQLFSEANSLFTVGRFTDNTLGARFGAVRQGEKEYAILPRTHSVTVILMVPKGFGGVTKKQRDRIRVVARTSMRSATDGSLLPQQDRDGRMVQVGKLVTTFLEGKHHQNGDRFLESPKCEDPDIHSNKSQTAPSDPKEPIPCTQALLQSVWANDFEEFNAILVRAGWKPVVGRFTRDLWMDVVESLEGSQYSGVRFELPNPTTPPRLPREQAILLVDDGKQHMRTTLTGGEGLTTANVRATLKLKLDSGAVMPLAGSTIVENNGKDLMISFPSPTLWKLDKLDIKDTTLVLNRYSHRKWGSTGEEETGEDVTYDSVAYRKANDPAKPVFAITKAADLIMPDTNHTGEISLFVEFAKDVQKLPLAKQVEIAVESGDIVQATFTPKKKSAVTLASELGRVVVSEDGTLLLKFRNLNKSKKLTIKSTAKDKDDKVVGGEHAEVTIEVS